MHLNFALRSFALIAVIATFSSVATAQVFDIGGGSFKGSGDKTRPRCQISIPSAAESPFFVRWNCVDDVNFDDRESERTEIRSTLWIRRPSDTRFIPIARFLGFPASVFIDESVLQIASGATFQSGLPIQVKIEASDVAGNTVITDPLVIRQQDNSLGQCDLQISTVATESDGSSTGVPSLTVFADDVEVNTQDLSATSLRLTSSTSAVASPCEIDSVCTNGDEITFDASIIISSDDGTSATGTVIVVPGSIAAEVTGNVSVNDAVLTSVEVSGTAILEDGTEGVVSLSCVQ